jgi:hypothetical protein
MTPQAAPARYGMPPQRAMRLSGASGESGSAITQDPIQSTSAPQKCT